MASLRFRSHRSSSRGSVHLALVAGLALGASWSTSARAAIWGSFDATRIAYANGPLTAGGHDELRTLIMDHGDEVGAPTGQLTVAYLDGVDVFYTSMLSDGTGPTAGAPGTLTLAEQTALQDWVAAGGTLIVAADANGLGGAYAPVYDSWTVGYGVTDYAFVFDFGSGMPAGVAHPITDGVGAYSLDNTMDFSYGADGLLLGSGLAVQEPFLVVFEPATGFAAGGRMLMVADHNALTDTYIGELDNTVLAANIVAWAAGECGNTIVESAEECDDGNVEDGDGCDAACVLEGAATSSGDTGADTTADSTGSPSSGTTAGSGGEPGSGSGGGGTTAVGDGTGVGSVTASTGAGEGSGSEDGGVVDGEGGGCGCRREPGPAGPGLLWLGWGVSVVVRRRRRRRRRRRADARDAGRDIRSVDG